MSGQITGIDRGRALKRRGEERVLRTFPVRYRRLGELTAIRDVRPGEKATVLAEVMSTPTTREVGKYQRGRRHLFITTTEVSDGTGTLSLTFFAPHGGHGNYIRSSLPAGSAALFSGTVKASRGHLELTSAEFQAVPLEGVSHGVRPEQIDIVASAFRPEPVYPEPEGSGQAEGGTDASGQAKGGGPGRRKRKRKTSPLAREIAEMLEAGVPEQLDDPLPREIREKFGVEALAPALRHVHAPEDPEDIAAAEKRFQVEEALTAQLVLALRRNQEVEHAAEPLDVPGALREHYESLLPFTLTDGQHRAIAELDRLIARPHPMNVLLQGDVGAGKTVVALAEMLRAVDSGHQAVLIAPTDVLARQHYATITGILGPFGRADAIDGDPRGTRVRLVTGSQRTAQRREALLDAASGDAGIVIGTHALLSESVTFADLALAVIDEQQRFGVDQRAALGDKAPEGRRPHTLVMTATPIPRTVAMTAFGELDVLRLAQAPGVRADVTSFVVPEGLERYRTRMWERAAEEIGGGGQVFVVCPRIGDDELEEVPDADERPPLRAVEDVAAEISAMPIFQGARIGILHSRLGEEERQRMMGEFVRGEVDLLVATTVVEVGVDIAGATCMVVLDAEMFGISQLHQLRGRVGRGTRPGICFFATRFEPGSTQERRLAFVASTTDGFRLADKDLDLRHEGDVLGAEQSGDRRSLRFVTASRDAELLTRVRRDARDIIDADPDLTAHPGLAALVREMVGDDAADTYLDRT